MFSTIFAETKSICVYLPNEHQEHKKYPLLICLDGQDYAEYGNLNFVLDNLMHQHEMMPTIVVQINSPDRFKEFAANPMYSTFIQSELLPHIESRYRIAKGPENRGITGVGLGAVAALHTQWRHPETFGKLLLQSGAFVFTDIGDHGRGTEWDSIVDFINSLRDTPNQNGTIYLSCGVFDSLIYHNRTMAHLWEPTNIKLRYVESKDGHNWIAWRDRLREGLTWLYPGHLRMIYD
jgi:enterochelin esterase family protein